MNGLPPDVFALALVILLASLALIWLGARGERIEAAKRRQPSNRRNH